MIVFPCHVCRTDLSAEDGQVGQLVRCPSCLTTLRVPSGAADPASALHSMTAPPPAPPPGGAYGQPLQQYGPPPYGGAPYPGGPYGGGYGGAPYGPPGPWGMPRGAGRRYGFNCGYCSSRLEATESMAAQEGQCPTCSNTITIPILDRYGRLIDPKTRQIVKQDPHPVHAYAAAGERAPGIVRGRDGKQMIKCPRCGGASIISANNCKGCGMPFTMEGTTLEAAGTSNGFCVASLVLGIIGLIPCSVGIPAVLAIIFGIIGFNQVAKSGAERGGKGMAIAGIIMGILGGIFALMVFGKF